MDSRLLPASDPSARPLPWRTLCALLVPAAGLAAGVGLQRLVEGPAPAGDALLRWLLLSGAAGLPLGLIAGVVLSKGRAGRAAWAVHGATSPFVVAALVLGVAGAVRPVRHGLARRLQARCRDSGRALCSIGEFGEACAAGAREKLGVPLREVCGVDGCTRRWLYTGPWTPDDYVAPGAVICSVVTGPLDRLARHALLPGDEQPFRPE